MSFKTERGNKCLRFLDRYIGIPIASILGLLSKKREVPEKIDKIGILLSAAIGDTVLASAFIADLKNTYPMSKIVFFAGGSNFSAAKLTLADKVVKIKVSNPLESIKLIKKEKFDVWIDLGQWARLNSVLSFFARADFKIGFKTKGQFRHYVYDCIVNHKHNAHEIDNFKALGVPIGVYGSSLPVLIYDELPPTSENYAVFHMFPSGYKPHMKEWGADKWAELLQKLESLFDAIYFTGVASDSEEIEKVIKLSGSKKAFSTAGIYDISALCSFLKNSKIVVSVNTGIMHLAWALDIKNVSISGPASISRWGALGKHSDCIGSPLDCSPCVSLGYEFKCKTNDCMRAISVDAVEKAVKNLLEKGY